ncbi:MAG: hypothetical protein U0232_14795 [Thermomicrobiales bacterium]
MVLRPRRGSEEGEAAELLRGVEGAHARGDQAGDAFAAKMATADEREQGEGEAGREQSQLVGPTTMARLVR